MKLGLGPINHHPAPETNVPRESQHLRELTQRHQVGRIYAFVVVVITMPTYGEGMGNKDSVHE